MRVHMGQCIHIYFLPLTSKEAWNQWHSSSNKHTQCSDRSDGGLEVFSAVEVGHSSKREQHV